MNPPFTLEELTIASDAKASLERLFGISMQFTEYESIIELSNAQGEADKSNGSIVQSGLFLPRDVDPRKPFMAQRSGDQYMIAFPIGGKEPESVFAVGDVKLRHNDLLMKLAELAGENVKLRNQVREQESKLESYADQVVQDFEERCWFEELACLEVCDISNDVEEDAERLLSHLRQIIHTETLAFFRACDDGGLTETSADQSSVAKTATCWTGAHEVDEDVCRRIVETYKDDAAVQPVVQNWVSSSREQAEFPGVHSFILIAVSRKSSGIGWLLAINHSSDLVPESSTLGFAVNQFGTEEARLLHAAGVGLGTHHHNVELFQANKDLALGAIQSLASTVDAKDSYTRGHSDRVGQMARELGRKLSLDTHEQEQLLMTGLLHDIGKIGVPDVVLRKPGKLTAEEFDLLKQHPEIGHKILEPIKPLAYVLLGVLHHHESFDGSGYPSGLAGHDIPMFGRILAIVDAYDAMTSDRPYRDGMPCETAEKILKEGAGTQWDPEMVGVFLVHVGDFRSICHGWKSDNRIDQQAAQSDQARDQLPIAITCSTMATASSCEAGE